MIGAKRWGCARWTVAIPTAPEMLLILNTKKTDLSVWMAGCEQSEVEASTDGQTIKSG